MKRVKLKKLPQAYLNEIFQALVIKFSLLKQTGEDEFLQASVEGKCRDFLGDCLWSKKFNKTATIYGFSYNYKKNPYDDDALKISMTFPSEESKANFIKNFEKLIHSKEKKAGVDALATVYEVEDEKNMLVIVADATWLKSPWRLSLYTYYLKVASYANKDEVQSPEKGYKDSLTNKAELCLLKAVKSAQERYSENLDVNHNYSGFVSLINYKHNTWLKNEEMTNEYIEIFGGKNV